MTEPDENPTADELPADVIETVERLTRQARRTDAEWAEQHCKRREKILDRHGFEARVREGSDGDVLVCYPAEWLEDGEVVLERIEDRSRAVERPLDTSVADWEVVERDNRSIVEAVEDEHGPIHGANVRAFADFMGNHHATRIVDATEEHVTEFLVEYHPRNAWPSDEQRAVVEESLRVAFEVAGVDRPPID
ncbi:DUF7108 family protein [Halorhabdus amylolytica]|uniref:DUF7108 family protein n=1 Tax=Halorhabdus amylolytica TaxID=2559573 RepID=UPI0010AA8838|nr:rnhA operon protein [Halorhabdus amylolytica]